MSLTYRAAGTVATGNASVAPGMPTGWAAGDLLVIFVGLKAATASPATPSGWTAYGPYTNTGTGDGVADQGYGRTYAYTRVAQAGDTAPTITITNGNSTVARMFACTASNGQYQIAETGGGDSTAGTAWSVTGAASIGIQWGDLVFEGSGINTDGYTFSSESLAHTGQGFGTATEVQDSGTTTGQDSALVVAYQYANSPFRAKVQGSGTTSFGTITEPSGAAQNDVLYAMLLVHNANTTVPNITTPSGWTLLNRWNWTTVQGNDRRLEVALFRIVRGASAPTLTFSATGTSDYREWSIVAIRGADTTTPESATAYTAATTVTNSGPDSPSVATAANEAVLSFVMHWGGDNGSNITPPTNHTIMENGSGVTNADIGSSFRLISSGTSEDPGTFGNFVTTGTWEACGASISVKPRDVSATPVYTMTASSSGTNAPMGSTMVMRVRELSTTPKSVTDTATGSDSAAAPTAALTLNEPATGADSAAMVFITSGSDSATGTDSATVAQTKTASDSATGTDTAALTFSTGVTESATGADTAAAPTAALTLDEPATGTDTAALSGAEAKTVTDTAAGTDTAALTFSTGVTDSATGADTAALAVAHTGTDPGTGTDTAAMAFSTGVTDSAAGTDTAAAPTAALTLNEPASGADTAGAPTAALTLDEPATGTDTATLAGTEAKSVTDTATGADTAAAPTAALALNEPATGTDTAAAPTAALTAIESATGSETTELTQTKSATDSATGADTFVLVVQLDAQDSGTGSDVAYGNAYLDWVDSAAGSEAIQVTGTGALTQNDVNAIVYAIMHTAQELGVTHIQFHRLIASAAHGLTSGGNTSTVSFRDRANTKDRIVLTVDSLGNRSASVLDGMDASDGDGPDPDTLTVFDLQAIANAYLGYVVENGATLAQMSNETLSVLANKASGAQTGTERFRDANDTKDRVVVTVDQYGNRTAVTRDGA